jgi:hypothetical protein
MDKKEMKLLDQFAAEALPSVILRAGSNLGFLIEKPDTAQQVAKSAYAIAKAMIEEREEIHDANKLKPTK